MAGGDVPHAVLVLVVEGHEVPLGVVGSDGPRGLHLVDAVSRLQLALRRCGAGIQLREVSPDLGELLELAGLAGVLAAVPAGPADRHGPDGPEVADGG